MSLPYANSKADPAKAQKRIREMLLKFGVKRVAFEEDFIDCVLIIRFIYNDYPISMPVDYGKLAEIYLEDDPWTSRKHTGRDNWNAEKREVACRASFSILEDFIKSLITIVEMGVFSFEEIFMSYFTDNQGQRLGEKLAPRLKEWVTGQLAIEGKGE